MISTNGRHSRTHPLARQLSLSAAILFVTACSTSAPGGNDSAALADSPTSAASSDSAFRNFSWTVPDKRSDGSTMKPSELKGYVLVVWQVKAGEQRLVPQIEGKTPSLKEFQAAGEEIKAFIQRDDIGALVKSGSGNSIVISSPRTTTYRLEKLEPGIYYAAISSFDQQNTYSELSSTVKFKIAP